MDKNLNPTEQILRNKIKLMEDEIKTLQATLRTILGCNETLRQQIITLGAEDPYEKTDSESNIFNIHSKLWTTH